MNLDRAGSQLDDLPVPRQVIGALALDLDGGIARRGLFDQAGELRQQTANRLRRRPDITDSDDPSLGVVGVALLAPTHHETVALASVHHKRDGLSSLAERDRQGAGGERIGRAGMPRPLAPLASGSLPIALGEATKTVPFVMDGRK